jgi:hypothetical protein
VNRKCWSEPLSLPLATSPCDMTVFSRVTEPTGSVKA